MRQGRLSIAPVFASSSVAAIDVGSVHVRLWRSPDAPPILDTVVTVTPGQTEFELELSVFLSAPEETLLLSLVLRDPAGVEVYRDAGDPTAITVSNAATPVPIPVPLEYVGPGAQAVTLTILESTLSVQPDGTVQAHAEARGAAGQVIANARIGWMALDPLVSFDDPTVGLIRAGSTPGEARVVAALPRVREGAPLVADTATVEIRTNQPPVADAGPDQQVTDTDLTGSETVTLDGAGSDDPDGTIASYVWMEGANQLATGVAPQVTLNVGPHTLTLTVTDDGGATGTDQVVITVLAGNQPPVADAGPDQQVTDTDLTGSETVMLDGTGSSDPDGTIVSYVWVEGAIPLATGVAPQVTLSVGTHTLTLTVTDDGGAAGTDQVVITVLASNQPPVANAGPDQQVTDTDLTGSQTVTLDGSRSNDPDGTIVSYVWMEGTNQLATGVSPQVPLAVGVHTITLTVTDDGGATGTDQVVITVLTGNQPPVADAGPDQQVTDADLTGSEAVTLDGSGSNDPDGTIVSYVWMEGANQLETGVTPQVSLSVGTHTITLTVTDDGGATGTDQVVITVLAGNQPPVADAGPDQQVTDIDLTGSETVTLDGSGSNDPDGTIASYVWMEGANQLATGVNPQVSLSVGTHTITLTATDDGGKTATDQVIVTVLAGNQPPVADAGPDQQVTDTDLTGSETVTLDGSGSSDPDGTIVSYVWMEGANQLATGVSQQVTLAVGVHTITLTATDDGGAAGTDQVVITVLAGNQPPVADAGPDQQVTDTDLTGSETVTLDGSGSNDPDGTIVSYVWMEGANQLATGVNPQVSLSVGTHTLTLTVTDDGGATGTDQVVITVRAGNQPPVADAGPDQQVTDTDLSGSETVTLDGSGSDDPDGTIVSYVWMEGANQLATGVSPQVTLALGVHTITLTVTDDGGKTATDQVSVTVQAGLATLTILGTGSGNGTVTSNPAGITCTITNGVASGDCTQQYPQGTPVTVTGTASAVAGVHQFDGWSGTGINCPGTGPCSMTMDVHRTVTAGFTEYFALTVQGAGTGAGTVTGGGGISCVVSGGGTQGTCSVLFAEGIGVGLSAAPGAGSAFTGWSGPCTGTGGCSVTLNQAQTVTASFDLTQVTLTVTIDGLGSVTSSGVTPAFNCSYVEGICSQTYPYGTPITLAATSQNPDFSFESWFSLAGSGFTCTTSPTCAFTMDQDRDLRVWFSVPGLISLSPTTAGFTMAQGGTPSPSSQTITASNIGDRPITGVTIQTAYSPSVAPWLSANIDRTTIDTLTPATVTLSVIANNLDPGVYTATVYVGDFVLTTGQVNVTLTVQSPIPLISGVSYQLVQLNDDVVCSSQNPPGSLLRFDFSYVDGDGDVNQATAVLTVAYQFNPGSSGQFQQPPELGLTVGGDGFSGTITSYICNVFGAATSVTENFTLQDSQGNTSNTLQIVVPTPPGSNSPPAGSSPAGAGTVLPAAGGAAVPVGKRD